MVFILDTYSRRIVGWSMDSHMRTELVVDALEMALWRHKPSAGFVHHSDRGAQYTAISFGRRLEEVDLVPSMGRTGSALDNAMAESFIATVKTELVHRRRFPDREVARSANSFEYLDGFNNRRRLPSALSYQSSKSYEEATMEGVTVAQMLPVDETEVILERHRPDLRLPHFMGAGLCHWSVHVQRARDAARLQGGGVGGSHAYADTRTGTTFTLTKNLLAPNFDTAEHVAQIVTKAVADS